MIILESSSFQQDSPTSNTYPTCSQKTQRYIFDNSDQKVSSNKSKIASDGQSSGEQCEETPKEESIRLAQLKHRSRIQDLVSMTLMMMIFDLLTPHYNLQRQFKR